MTAHVTMRAQSVPPMPTTSFRPSHTATAFDSVDNAQEQAKSDIPEEAAMNITKTTPSSFKATPGSGAAVFSTRNGRYPHRMPAGPPFNPAIVRSNFILGVVEYANYWRTKLPQYYHCFFTDAGWGITDLWDKADIHLESPVFLQEVLKFITKDNEFRAHRFATDWSTAHPDKLDAIGGDLTGIFDPNDTMSFVYHFFTDGETKFWPPEFLYQVLYMMRQAMRHAVEQQKRETDAAAANNKAGRTSGDHGNLYTSRAVSSTGHVSTSVRLPVHHHSDATGSPAEGHIVTAHPPTNGQLRNPKYKGNRQMSHPGPSNLFQGQAYTGMEQREHRAFSQRFQHNSGHDNIHQAPTQIQMGPGPVPMGGVGLMPVYAQPAPLMSPSFQPAQIAYPSVLQQGRQLPPPAMYGPPQAGPGYQMYVPPMPDARGVPFGELTNNMPYHADRKVDNYGSMHHRGNAAAKTQGLFNPYGAERPDKAANFTQIPTGKKGGRGSFSNSIGRGRKNSTGYRGSVSNTYDRDDASRVPSGMFTGNLGDRLPFKPPNPDIINDHEYGCDASWIGPSNTTVEKLYVSNFPNNVTEKDLLEKFKTKADAYRVDLRTAPGFHHITHAFVYFSSPQQASKCLTPGCKIELHNRVLTVSVPYVYYKVRDTSPVSQEIRPANTPTRHHLSLSSGYTSRSNATGKTRYSPQDARSDLQEVNRQSHQEYPLTHGSPQSRHQKSKTSPDKNTKLQSRSQLPKAETNAKTGKATMRDEKPKGAEAAVKLTSGKSVETKGSRPKAEKNIAESKIANVSTIGDTSTREKSIEIHDASTITKTPASGNTIEASDISTIDETSAGGAALEISDTSTARETLSSDEVSGEETVQPKSSPAPADLAILMSSSEKAVEDEATIKVHTPCTLEETISDDDQKNDLSFHSAPEAPEESAVYFKEQHVPEASAQSSNDDNQVLSSDTGVSHQAETPKVVPASNNTELGGTETGPSPGSPTKSSTAETTKKQGVKQTQSLYPFAKPSKTQVKKEKQAKKKDKKKERKEKTKPEKPAPEARSQSNTPVAIDDTTIDDAEPDVSEKEKDKTDDKTNEVLETAPQHEDQHSSVDDVSSTKEEAVAQMEHHQRVHSGNAGSDSGSALSDQDAAMPQAKASLDVEITMGKPQPTKETLKRKTAHLSQIAVPKLNLGTPKSFPSDLNVLSVTNSPPKGTSIDVGDSTQLSTQDSEKFHDTASVTSSSTLRPLSPPPPIPASATTEFFTPMPTPTEPKLANEAPIVPVSTPTKQELTDDASTVPTTSAANVAKKKKKSKSKKKKVKKAPDTQDEQPVQKELEAEPFSSQMDEIADIMAKKNEEPQEGTEGAGKDEGRDTKVGDDLSPDRQRLSLSDRSDSARAESSGASTSI